MRSRTSPRSGPTRARLTLSVRPARGGDAEAICLIYNQGIEDRVATLETELRTPGERLEWLTARSPRHPVLVATADGHVVGWGSLNRFNPRPAYDHVADLSVYVERRWRGRGVGRRLLEALVDTARQLGYHKMVLAAFPTNAAGMALYARLGFTRVGVYREQGRLDDRWVDVVIMERLL
jgi:L-amino acid N-acyltransferase YncA